MAEDCASLLLSLGSFEKLESSAKKPLLKEVLPRMIIAGSPSHLTTCQVKNSSEVKNTH